MSKLTEKAAYLKGLAEGLGLAPDTPERKLILALLDTVDEMATAMGAMEQRIQDAEDSIDEVSDCLLYTSPSPRDPKTSRMPSSA